MTTPSASRISRRSVAKGGAWAAPALLLTSAAPSASASGPFNPDLSGCQTLVWTNTDLSGDQGYNATRTAVVTLRNGEPMTVTATQRRIAGVPGIDPRYGSITPEGGDFSAAAAGDQRAWPVGQWGDEVDYYVVRGGTSSVLTLNQGTQISPEGSTRASESITFTFTDARGAARVPASLSFTVYDITSLARQENYYRDYTDQLTFTGASIRSTIAMGEPSVYDISNPMISGVASFGSTPEGNALFVTLTPSSPSVTLTYSNSTATPLWPDFCTQYPERCVSSGPTGIPRSANYQQIGLGDLSFCF